MYQLQLLLINVDIFCITRWSKEQKICTLCRTPFTKVNKLNNNYREFLFIGDKSKF